MTNTRKTPFTKVALRDEAATALRAATLELTTPETGRVTLSDAVTASLAVAMRHRDELAAELRRTKGSAK